MKNVTINLLNYFWKKGIKPIKNKLEELKKVAFSGKYSDLSDTPNALKNPNALTFTGAVTGSYDGSNDKSVKIPSVTNNLLATQQGTALDAVQGKVLDDKIGTINSNLKLQKLIEGNEILVGKEYESISGTLNYTTFYCSIRWTPYRFHSIFANDELHLNTIFIVESGNYVCEFHALIKFYKSSNKIKIIKAYQENRELNGTVTRFEIDTIPLVIYGCNIISI